MYLYQEDKRSPLTPNAKPETPSTTAGTATQTGQQTGNG